MTEERDSKPKLNQEVQDLITNYNSLEERANDLFNKIYRLGVDHGLQKRFVSEENEEKFLEWRKKQDEKVVEMQKGSEHDRGGRPYYGCSGGELVWTYCPTTIGVAIKVRHEVTGEVLDLSDWS